MPESGIKTEIEITLHDSVDKHWSADPLLMKFMKIIVVQSTSPIFSSRLTAGSLPLEPRAFTRDPNYSASSVDYKIIDIKGKLNPEHGTDTTDNKILVYRYKLGFQTNSRPTHLNYYVTFFLNKLYMLIQTQQTDIYLIRFFQVHIQHAIEHQQQMKGVLEYL